MLPQSWRPMILGSMASPPTVWARLDKEHYTPEQVLGDWFPGEPG